MKIIPYLGEKPFRPSEIRVNVDKADEVPVFALIARAKELGEFDEEEDLMGVLREIVGVKKVIKAEKDAAKSPFLNTERAIEETAKKYIVPLEKEELRLKALVSDIAIEKKKDRQRQDAKAALMLGEKVIEEIRKLEALQKSNAEKGQLVEQELAVDLAKNTVIAKETEPLLEGATPRREPKFKLLNPVLLFDWMPFEAQKLLDCTLRIRACQDQVKQQLACGIPEERVKIPGVEITWENTLSVRGTSQIVQR